MDKHTHPSPTPVPYYEFPFVRSPYNYDKDAVSFASGLSCPEPTMAQQQFRDETDINTIVERFGITGQLPTNVRMPQYGDFLEVVDFHTAQNAIRQAEESFMTLPANIRERFGHDPAAFVDFCSDDANLDEARKLGLVKTPPSKPSSPPAGGPPAEPSASNSPAA